MLGTRRSRLIAAVAALVALALTAGWWFFVRDTNPLAGKAFYVATDSQAAVHLADADVQRDPAAKQAVSLLAGQPTAVWFSGGSPEQVRNQAHHEATLAAEQHKVLVGVVYNLPNRGCGDPPGHPKVTPDDYRTWLLAMIDGLRVDAKTYPDATVVLAYEPDGLAHTVGESACIKGNDVKVRRALMAESIKMLKNRPGILVASDMANPSWFTDVHDLVAAFKEAGGEQADWFIVNVSNFQSIADNARYASRISDELGGMHYLIDTSRNGNGARKMQTGDDPTLAWCNPPGIRIGHTPTTDTGIKGADALVWIKPQGESDGACRPGEEPAGDWSTRLAVAAVTGAAA
jgi:endoglucanase